MLPQSIIILKIFFHHLQEKNFRILERKFEDYELIVGFENFWILKAKGIHENLVNQMNIASEVLFNSSLEKCSSRYDDIGIINKMCDIIYL